MTEASRTLPEQVEAQLEDLVFAEGFTRLREETGSYCPFRSVGAMRAELRHGAFLSDIMNPAGAHGYGDSVLKAFLVKVVGQRNRGQQSSYFPSVLDIHLSDLGDARVTREWKRIDILIEIPSKRLVIAIELKVNAQQSEGQLARYRQKVEEHWPERSWTKLYVFLTKHEEQPEAAEQEFWQPVGLADFAAAACSVQPPAGADNTAAIMLAAYVAMLRREHVMNEELEQIAQELWRQYGAALTFLMDRKPDACGRILSMLNESATAIRDQLSAATGKEWEVDQCGTGIVRFAFKPWDELDGFKESVGWTPSNRLALFEIKRIAGGDKDRLVALLILGPGQTASRDAIAAVIEREKKSKRKGRVGDRWGTLATQDLLKVEPMDEIDEEAKLIEIAEKFVVFVKKSVTEFDETFREALAPV